MKSNRKPQPPLVGQWVRYYVKGWRHGRLLEMGRKWAVVHHPVLGRKRIRIKEIQLSLWQSSKG